MQLQGDAVVQSTTGKRRYKRSSVDGYIGEIADGNKVLSGIVGNVSSSGLRISNLPIGFSTERKHYVAVVSGFNKHYKIVVRPRWYKVQKGDVSVDVGFKILAAPWEWTEFISTTVPEIIG